MTNVKRFSNKSQETRKIKKILHEEIRLGLNSRSDSENEEVDLKKELFPLGHYINDREEMIEQMFSIIKGEKLKKILPPILKDIPLDEIKADCLIHLLGMSTKRIMATLEGREIYSSSDSETNSGGSTSPNKKSKLELKPFMIKQEGCSDISDNSEEVVLIEPDAESSRSAKEGQKHKKRHRHKKKILPEKTKKIRKNVHQEKVKKSHDTKIEHHESSKESENEAEGDSPKKEKSLLEMLELEMRRRAIQALLDKEGPSEHIGIDSNLEQLTKRTKYVSEKRKKPNKTDNESEKITPVKNFRKKKHKNDDVIVIVPKLVTIDLTDENKKSNVDSNKNVNEPNNEEVEKLINSINTDEGKDQLHQNNPCTDTSEECSNTSETKSDAEVEGNQLGPLVVDEVIDIPDSPEQVKSQDNKKKEQPKENEIMVGEEPRSNWALRWLESKDVKKVVSTSKICGNIRKKIKNAKLAKKTQENLAKGAVESPEIHGSVVEYQSLPKSCVTLNMTTETVTDNNTEDKVSRVDKIDENETVIVFKAPVLVVEQVQDVSSTKNETSVMNTIQLNETLNSNSDDLQTVDNSQEIKNIESSIVDTTSSKSYLYEINTDPKLSDSGILENNQEVNISDKNLVNISTSSNELLGSGVANNLESENMTTKSPNREEFECEVEPCQRNVSPDKDLDNYCKINNNTENEQSSNNLEICVKESSVIEFSNKSTDSLPSMELLGAAQEISNEPEALEIDITEEDREIE